MAQSSTFGAEALLGILMSVPGDPNDTGCAGATSRRISCGLKGETIVLAIIHRVVRWLIRMAPKLANLGIAVFTEERKLASCDRVVEIVVPINTGDLRFVTHAPPFRVNSMHVLGAYYWMFSNREKL